MNAYNATIGGLQYTLNVVKDEAWMRRLTTSVDARICEIRDAMPAVGTTQVAVLACLNAMHDYYELEQERDDILAALAKADPAAAARYRPVRSGHPPVPAADAAPEVPEPEVDTLRTENEPVLERPEQPDPVAAGDARRGRAPRPGAAADRVSDAPSGDGQTVNPFAGVLRQPAHPKRAPGISIDPITGKARPPRQPASTAIDPLAPKRPKAVSTDAKNPFASYKKEASYAVDPLTGAPRPPKKHSDSGSASVVSVQKPLSGRDTARRPKSGESDSGAVDPRIENRLKAERAWAAGRREIPASGRENRSREGGHSGQSTGRHENGEPLKGKRINPFLPR